MAHVERPQGVGRGSRVEPFSEDAGLRQANARRYFDIPGQLVS